MKTFGTPALQYNKIQVVCCPSLPARCSEALAQVTAFRQEAQTIVFLSNSSRLPVGYGFLLAEGLRLTEEELLMSQSAEEEQIFDRLLSQSRSALQLAAYSSKSHCLRPHIKCATRVPKCLSSLALLHIYVIGC